MLVHDALLQLLDKHQQSHLCQFWDQLDPQQQTQLSEQIANVDFEELRTAVGKTPSDNDWGALAARSTSPPAIRLAGANSYDSVDAKRVGEEALSGGRIGALLVAGGQGSRLGFHHPKGMYPVGPLSERTLFQVFVDQLLALQRRHDVRIPLYLMTSPATHAETIEYFQQHSWLGLDQDQVRIFCQGTMPAIDAETGKLLLADKGALFLSPDGHGGTLAALHRAGCLDHMAEHGVDQLFYFQVDNPLVAVADSVFVGYHLLAGSEMTTQVIAKHDPLERVGNVVAVDGHLQIIEYSDLPDDVARRVGEDGSLEIWAGSIAVHMFDCSFLRRMAESDVALPWHLARKKVPFVNADGMRVEPEEPNAIKLERFIFDLLPSAKNALVVEVDEQSAFAPLKNATGAPKDTPETTRAAIVALHRNWLQQAGCDVAAHVQVEIHPNFALDAEELASKIDSTTSIAGNHYFQ